MSASRFPHIRVSITVLMLFQVSALFSRAYLDRHMTAAGLEAQTASFLAELAGLLLLGLFLWPVVTRERASLAVLFSRPRSWRRLLAYALSIGLFIRLAWWSGVVAGSSFGLAGPGDVAGATSPTWWWSCPSPGAIAMSVLLMVLATPLFEELISRGLILPSLLHQHGRPLAITGSSLLFAVLHDPSGIAYAFVFGLVAAVFMLSCRTLWGPIIAHGTANGLGILDWHCLHSLWIPATTSASTGLVALVLTALCIIAALKVARKWSAGAACSPRRNPAVSRKT